MVLLETEPLPLWGILFVAASVVAYLLSRREP